MLTSFLMIFYMLGVILNYTGCRYVEYRYNRYATYSYAEYCYAEGLNRAECHCALSCDYSVFRNAEWHYVECREQSPNVV